MPSGERGTTIVAPICGSRRAGAHRQQGDLQITLAKKNCWELIFCGREPGGARVKDLGVCPAATDTRHHGVNGGSNAGRYCWKVAGTLCGGTIQGEWAEKIRDCHLCKFFLHVKNQEGDSFIP